VTLPPNIPKPSLRNRWVSLAGLLAFAAGTATCAACNGIAFVSDGQMTISEQGWEFMSWGPASYILLVVGIGGGIGFLVWLAVHLGAKGRLG
jgi:hypothetical protein